MEDNLTFHFGKKQNKTEKQTNKQKNLEMLAV